MSLTDLSFDTMESIIRILGLRDVVALSLVNKQLYHNIRLMKLGKTDIIVIPKHKQATIPDSWLDSIIVANLNNHTFLPKNVKRLRSFSPVSQELLNNLTYFEARYTVNKFTITNNKIDYLSILGDVSQIKSTSLEYLSISKSEYQINPKYIPNLKYLYMDYDVNVDLVKDLKLIKIEAYCNTNFTHSYVKELVLNMFAHSIIDCAMLVQISIDCCENERTMIIKNCPKLKDVTVIYNSVNNNDIILQINNLEFNGNTLSHANTVDSPYIWTITNNCTNINISIANCVSLVTSHNTKIRNAFPNSVIHIIDSFNTEIYITDVSLFHIKNHISYHNEPIIISLISPIRTVKKINFITDCNISISSSYVRKIKKFFPQLTSINIEHERHPRYTHIDEFEVCGYNEVVLRGCKIKYTELKHGNRIPLGYIYKFAFITQE